MDDEKLPIIDAHHHFWDPDRNYHPWLRDEPMIPFRYGNYTALRRRFMPEDYRQAHGPLNVVASVTMEGEWDEATPVAESAWITEVARTESTPVAHVARAFLDRADVDAVLAGHAAYPIVRGIRHKPTPATSPDDVERGRPGSMSDPAWLKGYTALRDYGLHFELQTPWWHVRELMDLIDRHPETPVVINHAFMPTDRSPDAMAGWRKAITLAATAPQVSMKISGIGIAGRPWTLEDQRPVIDGCLEAFGVERAMFASNFPVDGLCGTFPTIYQGYLDATRSLSLSDRLRLFHDNAIRIYRLLLAPLVTDLPE